MSYKYKFIDAIGSLTINGTYTTTFTDINNNTISQIIFDSTNQTISMVIGSSSAAVVYQNSAWVSKDYQYFISTKKYTSAETEEFDQWIASHADLLGEKTIRLKDTDQPTGFESVLYPETIVSQIKNLTISSVEIEEGDTLASGSLYLYYTTT